MALNKNIIDIIQTQNSCRDVIQELYTYETRPNDILRDTYKNAKIDDAIRLDIIEHDALEDELSLSSDTEEYYKTRLGQNDETTISSIDDKISKLKIQLNYYNKRVTAGEDAYKEVRAISKLLNQIPTILRYNLYTISSNSIFAFKNEPNFDIKMDKLELSKKEIQQLIQASISVDRFLKEQKNFFKSINNIRINHLILKINKNTLELEYSFRMLYEEIKKFINKSIKDGEFIKKLQKLRELKQQNQLFIKTDIQERVSKQKHIVSFVKERKIHPDDRVFEYIDTIQESIKKRQIELQDTKEETELSYDIDELEEIEKTLYNYPKLHKEFLAQDDDLATFLYKNGIDRAKLLGVFVRLLKHNFLEYEVGDDFIEIDKRKYIIVKGL
ncbi:MAG: hypothetical protein ABGW74_03310 [Campylobacterales bacterium]